MGRRKGGCIQAHIGTNNADKEGSRAIVEKYRNILKKMKQARVGQIILSGMLPVLGSRSRGYRNSRRMAVNWMVKQLCSEEDMGFVDLWDSLWGKKKCTQEMACILVQRGQPFLPRDCQGQLPMAWVKYDV